MANPLLFIPLGNIIPVPNMRVPVQGAQALPIVVDLTVNTAVDGSLEAAYESGVFDFPQSVFIDNSGNGSTLTLLFPGAGPVGQSIVVQANWQGIFPSSPAMGDPRFSVSSAGGVKIPITFYNVPMPYFSWGPITATATFATPQASFTDRSGSITTGGTSQQLAAINANRKRIIIENPASATGQNIATAESLFINFTTAAGVNNGTSIELIPGGTFDSGSGPVSTQAITVNAATIGHVYIAKEA